MHAAIFRPYKYKIANIINIICELVLSLVSILIFGFIEVKNNGLQWAVIIFIIVGFMTNILLLLLHKCINMRNKSTKVMCQAPVSTEVQFSQIETSKNANITNKNVPDSFKALDSPSFRLNEDLPSRPNSRHNSIRVYPENSKILF